MTCSDAKLKLPALLDSELDDSEIPVVVNHMESCYKCRNDYIDLLRLKKRMDSIEIPEPENEWFEMLQQRIARRLSALVGKALFFGSYLLLLAYALYSFFSSSEEGILLKILGGGIFLGLLILLGVTVMDRVRESKTDKYKGVTK